MATRALVANLRCVLYPHKNLFTHMLRSQATSKQVIEGSLRNNDDSSELDPLSETSSGHKAFLDNLQPPVKRSYNFAAYVNSSKCLQELVKLGVSLYDIENLHRVAAKHIVTLDFERDCIPYIMFLVDHGLKKKNLGRFISEYPSIFKVDIEDLKTRLHFLRWRKFSIKQISQALNRSSQILCHETKYLNEKLDQIQSEFELPSTILRTIVSKYPPVVSLPSDQYKLIQFTLFEEFGFTTRQIHSILEAQPYIMDIIRPILIERLDLIHNHVGLSHETIEKFPKLITGPRFEIRYRFEYLKKLKRNQFDPEKPLYVPPSALYNGTDEEFCQKFAKTNLEDYKLFIKSC